MAAYQVFFLDSNDKVRHSHDLECEGDAEVIERVQHLDWGDRGVEIWAGDRLVHRFDPLPPS